MRKTPSLPPGDHCPQLENLCPRFLEDTMQAQLINIRSGSGWAKRSDYRNPVTRDESVVQPRDALLLRLCTGAVEIPAPLHTYFVATE